jgi:hypothetical protein
MAVPHTGASPWVGAGAEKELDKDGEKAGINPKEIRYIAIDIVTSGHDAAGVQEAMSVKGDPGLDLC